MTQYKEFLKKLKRNTGAKISLALLGVLCFFALFAPFIAPFDPTQIFDGQLKLPPFWLDGGEFKFLLGTDDLGRDQLSRLIYGARVSLGVGALVVILALSVGLVLGVISGYAGGWVDSLIMRIVDVLMSMPSILLAIVIVSILGPSLINGVIAVSVMALPAFIRIVRASVMAEKHALYVVAGQNFGASHLRQVFINILPNVAAPIIVQATLGFSDGILNIAALGFLGLGAQAPTSEWGTMLADARSYIETAPWLVTMPGVCILIAVLTFNILGDGLRDILDPKLR